LQDIVQHRRVERKVDMATNPAPAIPGRPRPEFNGEKQI